MNLDELQSVQSRERQTDSLQQLRSSFYEDAGKYIQGLRDERDQAAEQAADPFDAPEVNRLSDDIKTAEQAVEALYERRVGKIVKMASLAAADMPTEEDGLTREERELFETLVGAIEQNRDHVLDVLEGSASPGAVTTAAASSRTETPVESETEQTASDEQSESAIGAADVMGAADESGPDVEGDGTPTEVPPDEPPAEIAGDDGPGNDTDGPSAPEDGDSQANDDVDRKTVRITDDVGAILGVDEREYDLSTDDVVTLPTANADPLVARDAAEDLE